MTILQLDIQEHPQLYMTPQFHLWSIHTMLNHSAEYPTVSVTMLKKTTKQKKSTLGVVHILMHL